MQNIQTQFCDAEEFDFIEGV